MSRERTYESKSPYRIVHMPSPVIFGHVLGTESGMQREKQVLDTHAQCSIDTALQDSVRDIQAMRFTTRRPTCAATV